MSKAEVVISIKRLDDGMFLVQSYDLSTTDLSISNHRAEVAPSPEVILVQVKRILTNAGYFEEKVN